MNQVTAMNKMLLMATNNAALGLEIIPAGISRTAVRGLSLSNFSSIYRLKAMAALRANTIHNTTARRMCHSNGLPSYQTAKNNPMSAKGNAKMVWLNLMSDR